MSYDSAYMGAYRGARDCLSYKDRLDQVMKWMEEDTRREVDREIERWKAEGQYNRERKELFEKHFHELNNVSIEKRFDYLSEYIKYFVERISEHNSYWEFDEWLCKKLFYPYFEYHYNHFDYDGMGLSVMKIDYNAYLNNYIEYVW